MQNNMRGFDSWWLQSGKKASAHARLLRITLSTHSRSKGELPVHDLTTYYQYRHPVPATRFTNPLKTAMQINFFLDLLQL